MKIAQSKRKVEAEKLNDKIVHFCFSTLNYYNSLHVKLL